MPYELLDSMWMVRFPEAGAIEESFECKPCAEEKHGKLVTMSTFLGIDDYKYIDKDHVITGGIIVQLIVEMDEIDQFVCRTCCEPLYGYCE